MDFLRVTSLVESRQHRGRRNTAGAIGNLFKTAIGTAFANFLSENVAEKPTLQQNEEMIKQNFKRINEIIDTVDEHITKRMEVHEEELFGIVREEVEEMRRQTQRIVETLNEKITEKDVDSEVWKLNNELDYFKNESWKLFQENKRFKLQIRLLRKSIVDFQTEQQSLDGVLQKLTKREMRGRIKDKKMKAKNKVREGIKTSRRYERRHGSIIEEEDEAKKRNDMIQQEEKEDSIIDIQINDKKQTIEKKFQFQQKHEGQSISLPSLNIPSENQQKIPYKIHLKQVQSFSMHSQHIKNNSNIVQKQSKQVQTDPVQIISSQMKKNAFIFNRQKNLLAQRTQYRQRCRTQRNINLSTRKSEANVNEKHVVKMNDWIGSEGMDDKYVNKVVNHMKMSKKSTNKSMMYVSGVLGRNKLQPGGNLMVQTVRTSRK